MNKKIIKFLVLLAMAVGAAHYAPVFVSAAFFLLVLLMYFRSEGDEPFWLAFFLVIQDGILGYFLNFENLIPILPGLPAIEVGQLYIGLTIIKAARSNGGFKPFYATTLWVILIYIIFLILQGYTWGLSLQMNIQFRLLKWVIPLFLFYSLPKLMDKEEDYETFFKYLFPISFTVLIAQVFTITNGVSPAEYFGVSMETNHLFAVSEEMTYRGFFNDNVLIITLFGALFFLSRQQRVFSTTYLYLVILSNFMSVFLSATRGWVLAFSFILVGYIFLVAKIKPTRVLQIGISGALVIAILYSYPIIRVQVDNAYDRMLTLNALAHGDLTAGGTLLRLKERGPRVMKRWRESPLTGIGFSNDFFKFGDLHVGNQNILLHSGIIGALIMAYFFGSFCLKLYFKGLSLPRKHPDKRIFWVFIIFLLGWLMIHSSSSQNFSFYQNPSRAIIQSFFFTFAALVYQNSQVKRRGEDADEPLPESKPKAQLVS